MPLDFSAILDQTIAAPALSHRVGGLALPSLDARLDHPGLNRRTATHMSCDLAPHATGRAAPETQRPAAHAASRFESIRIRLARDCLRPYGIDDSMSPDELRAAWRRLARQLHPDRGGDASVFQFVRDAVVTLSNPGV